MIGVRFVPVTSAKAHEDHAHLRLGEPTIACQRGMCRKLAPCPMGTLNMPSVHRQFFLRITNWCRTARKFSKQLASKAFGTKPPALKPSLETMGLSFVAEHCGVVVAMPDATTATSYMSTLEHLRSSGVGAK